MAKMCQIASHPRQTDDAQCATCHSADASGIVPIAASHEVLSRTRVRGLQIVGLAMTGGTGAMGTVQAGDVLTLHFKLEDSKGNGIADLKTNAALSSTLVIAGPTNDRQRVIGPLTVKTAGTLAYDGTAYSYTLPAPFPAQALSPYNTTSPGRQNGAGNLQRVPLCQ